LAKNIVQSGWQASGTKDDKGRRNWTVSTSTEAGHCARQHNYRQCRDRHDRQIHKQAYEQEMAARCVRRSGAQIGHHR
jgi:hypothetical protein